MSQTLSWGDPVLCGQDTASSPPTRTPANSSSPRAAVALGSLYHVYIARSKSPDASAAGSVHGEGELIALE